MKRHNCQTLLYCIGYQHKYSASIPHSKNTSPMFLLWDADTCHLNKKNLESHAYEQNELAG